MGLFTGSSVYLIYYTVFIAYGDLRINGGGKDGRLEFQDRSGNWRTICTNGFDDDAGDVACDQLGYVQSSDVYYSSRYMPNQ